MERSDWDWLRREVNEAAAGFAAQLATVEDTGWRVPNLEWSVAELAAHLLSMPPLYRRLRESAEPFVPPPDWTEFSRAARAHITATDGDDLGRSLRAGAEAFVDHLGPDPDAPWTLYGRPTTAANMAAGYLGELLLHGRDLALLTGAGVSIDARQANAILRQHLTLAPVFVDPEKARRCSGTYRVSFRGGEDYTFTVADGALRVEPGRPARADGTFLADPVTFLLVALGRSGPVRAGLTGRILAYGRNPMKLWRLGRIQVDGV